MIFHRYKYYQVDHMKRLFQDNIMMLLKGINLFNNNNNYVKLILNFFILPILLITMHSLLFQSTSSYPRPFALYDPLELMQRYTPINQSISFFYQIMILAISHARKCSNEIGLLVYIVYSLSLTVLC